MLIRAAGPLVAQVGQQSGVVDFILFDLWILLAFRLTLTTGHELNLNKVKIENGALLFLKCKRGVYLTKV